MQKPERNNNIPKNSQWLSGIGAGSWFCIQTEADKYRIERFSPEGELECSRLFTVEPHGFDVNKEYKFTYISHCKECNITQNNITFKFLTNEY